MHNVAITPECPFVIDANCLPFNPNDFTISTKHSDIGASRDGVRGDHADLDVGIDPVVVDI